MTIRNALLGGTDLASSDILTPTDFNDTFNAAANQVYSLTAFWLQPSLRELYDDFSSYAHGSAIPSGSLWTSTGSAGTTFLATSSGIAGPATKEAIITVTCSNIQELSRTVELIGLTANKHTFLKLYISASANDDGAITQYVDISFNGGSDFDRLFYVTQDPNARWSGLINYSSIMVIAKGSGEYDCYAGGRLFRTVTDSSFTIQIKAYSQTTSSGASASVQVYIADVYQSRTAV